MFNNLVSVHDFEKVATRFRQGGMVRYVHRMFQAPERRVASAWQHTESTARRWTDIPAVRERCNHLITGNRHGDPRQFFIDTFLPDRSNLTALSLACGTGSNELAWARKGVFSRIVGVDISPDRIAVATDAARAEGLSDVLRFEVRDVQAKLPDGPFDLVIAEGALHHLSNLSRLLPEITGILRPEGYLVLNDFVGPSRFQWTDRQLEIIDGLLLVLPDSYRHRRVTGDIKRRFHRPGRLLMQLSDPSEAVESSAILETIRKCLEPILVRPYGGSVLHLLFDDIAHNFLRSDEETRQLLDLCFQTEDWALNSGQVASDFVFGVYKKAAGEAEATVYSSYYRH